MLPRIIYDAPLILKTVLSKQNKTKTKYDNFFVILVLLLSLLSQSSPKMLPILTQTKHFFNNA
jgi:hypothetical protein